MYQDGLTAGRSLADTVAVAACSQSVQSVNVPTRHTIPQSLAAAICLSVCLSVGSFLLSIAFLQAIVSALFIALTCTVFLPFCMGVKFGHSQKGKDIHRLSIWWCWAEEG